MRYAVYLTTFIHISVAKFLLPYSSRYVYVNIPDF